MPQDYADLLDQLKRQVRGARVQATRVVNTQLLVLYWDIGRAIRDRQDSQGWGTRVIDRLAADLRAEFPDMRGFSRSNLHYMRTVASAWPREAIVQQPVGQLPWGHITVLIDKIRPGSPRLVCCRRGDPWLVTRRPDPPDP
jgi:predicted nuclease of restriction endonuclease-like (RecB) superfamily